MYEKIKAEVERYIESARKAHTSITESNFAHLLSFIESLEKEQPKGLDEAAHNHAANNGGRWLTDDIGIKCFAFNPQEVEDAFKAGAKWMAEQGYTTEAIVMTNPLAGLFIPSIEVGLPYFNKSGDKVIVQIRK